MYKFIKNSSGVSAIAALRNASVAYQRAFMRTCGLEDFTPNEMEVLICIGQWDRVCTATEIVRALGISKTLVSHSVESLMERGLISGKASLTDARSVLLFFTAEGKRIAGRIARASEQFLACARRGITQEEFDAFVSVIERMTSNLEQASADSAVTG